MSTGSTFSCARGVKKFPRRHQGMCPLMPHANWVTGVRETLKKEVGEEEMERPMRAVRDDVSNITIEEHSLLNMSPQSAESRHCSQPFSLHSECNMCWNVGGFGERSHDQCFLHTECPGLRGACPEGQGKRTISSLDRQLQTLEDRLTIIILIHGQEEKAKVKNIRDEWQKQKARKGQRTSIWRVTTQRGVGTAD